MKTIMSRHADRRPAPSSVRQSPPQFGAAAPKWVGRLSFVVERVRHGRSHTVELMLRRDTFETLVEGRSVGVGDRDALRLWMALPRESLPLDDARLAMRAGGGTLVLTVDQSDYPVPTMIEAKLRRDT